MPTSALTEARGALIAALQATGLSVHAGDPSVATPPCLLVVPGTPVWISPRGLTAWDVISVVTSADGWPAIEDLIERVRLALWEAGMAPLDTDPPTTDTDAGAISARTQVQLRINCK